MITKNKYSASLPEGYSLVDSMVELYELIPKRRKYVMANLQLIDSPIVVYSDYSDRYFMRHSRDQPSAHLRTFVRKLRVYVPEDRKCHVGTIQERESHLMLEYLEADKSIVGRETKIKMIKLKLKELKDGTAKQ